MDVLLRRYARGVIINCKLKVEFSMNAVKRDTDVDLQTYEDWCKVWISRC